VADAGVSAADAAAAGAAADVAVESAAPATAPTTATVDSPIAINTDLKFGTLISLYHSWRSYIGRHLKRKLTKVFIRV
jgi:hypothetical protein